MKLLSFLSLAFCLVLPASADLTPQELAKRQCRSVHLQHKPIPEKSEALYMEIVPLKCSPGTYFCAANFNDGYIGMQELANKDHILIFSIWDPIPHGQNPNEVPEEDRVKAIQKGTLATIDRFGGEGTGGKSFYKYPWKMNEKVKFLVVRKPIDDKFKQISGYFFNNNTKKWELISSWRTHRSDKEFSFAASFVEDFLRNTESATKERAAAFGPVFAYTAEKKWEPVRSVGFTADGTDSAAIACEWDAKQKAYVLKTGGKTKTGDFKLWAEKDIPEGVIYKAPDKSVEAILQAPLLKEKPGLDKKK